MTDLQNRNEVLERSQMNTEPTFVDVAIGFLAALILIGFLIAISLVF